jgi:hypothetical protein
MGRYSSAEKKKLIAEVKRLRKSGKVTSIAAACKKAKVPLPTFYFWTKKQSAAKPVRKQASARR